MPGFDRTGPMGQGPMSGRQFGRCTNYGAAKKRQPSPENETTQDETLPPMPFRGGGFGLGRGGRGRGLGMQNRFRGCNW